VSKLEEQVGGLKSSSRRAALLATVGGMIVFGAIGTGAVVLLMRNDEIRRQLAIERELRLKLEAEQGAAQDLADRIEAISEPEACSDLREQIATPAVSPNTPRERARAEWRAGLAIRRTDPARAVAHFDAAIRADTSFPAPYNSLGRMEFDRGNRAKATEYYRAALAQSRAYSPALYNLAIVNLIEGRVAEAQAQASELVRLRPDDRKAQELQLTIQQGPASAPAPMP
jgi:tetratricopeptide (TPR) repeat protein